MPEFKMTSFKLNDVVVIIKNPPNQIVKIKGDIGYIDEFQEATNEKGEVVKYVYFKTIKLNSLLGGMGSVPIDCIELCDNPVYLKRFQEILEYKNKEKTKNEFIDVYCKLEDNLKSKEEEIIKLKEKSQTLNEAFELIKINLSNQCQMLMKLEADKISTRLSELNDEIIKVKQEMNTPINQRVAWYLECQRYG
jgi:hypothetical protein